MIEVTRDIDGIYKISVNPITKKFVSYNPSDPRLVHATFGKLESLEERIAGQPYHIKSLYEEKPERTLPVMTDEELRKRAPGFFKLQDKQETNNTNSSELLETLKEKMFNKGIQRLLKAYKKADESDSDFIAGIVDVLTFMFPDKKEDILDFTR